MNCQARAFARLIDGRMVVGGGVEFLCDEVDFREFLWCVVEIVLDVVWFVGEVEVVFVW